MTASWPQDTAWLGSLTFVVMGREGQNAFHHVLSTVAQLVPRPDLSGELAAGRVGLRTRATGTLLLRLRNGLLDTRGRNRVHVNKLGGHPLPNSTR